MSRHTLLTWVVVIAGSALAGALLPIYPLYAYATVMVAAALLILSLGKRAITLFLIAQVSLVAGYAFLGRGFAYLGLPPLFVGEMALVLGCFALVTALPTRRLDMIQVLILVFMAWGATRTLPYIGIYGLNALRDGATWGYALFAVVLSLVLRGPDLRRFFRLYAALVPLFVVWVPAFALAWFVFGHLLPTAPGSFVRIPFFKAGDVAVHLAGAGAFILAGIYQRQAWRSIIEPGLWIFWLAGFVIVSVISRSAMIATGMVATMVFFRPVMARWITAISVGMILVGLVGLTNVEIQLPGARNVSAAQLVDNIASVLNESDDPALADSRRWREDWWNLIIAYTFDGPYLWLGRGFGINLADEDGFQTPDGLLRAPHNAHLNLLARGGVPMLGIWLAIQLAFAAVMIRAAYLAARSGRRAWVGTLAWIFVYWLAAIANMTFDVYLEGPQGGITFWSVMGLGLAAASYVRRTSPSRSTPAEVTFHGTNRESGRARSLPQTAAKGV